MSAYDFIEALERSSVLAFLARAAVLLAAAWALSGLMRRAGAAARAQLWRLAFAGVAALPLVPLALPAWTLELPATRAAATPGGRPADAPAHRIPGGVDARAGGAPARPAPAAVEVGATRDAATVSWSTGLFAAWALGLLLGLGRLLASVRRARRLVARAGAPQDRGWLDAFAVVERHARRPIELRCSPEVEVPFVWDPLPWGTPAVVVPEGGPFEGDARKLAALRHELAHVTRRDGAALLLARLAALLCWPLPLARLGLRRLSLESERACDDVVLRAGARPSQYAGQLLELDERAALSVRPAWVQLFEREQLELRLAAILDERRNRRPLSARAARATALLCACCVAPIAAIRAQEATPASSQEPASARSRGVAALVALQDAGTGAWRGDVGYKLNNDFVVTAADRPHVGVTGLALEALLRAGADPPEEPSASAISAGAAFLVGQQDERGYISAHGTRLREHALATAALAELERRSPSAPRRDALEAAARFILAQQNATGGWRFQPGDQDTDVLETAYQLRALLAARAAGVRVDDQPLARALAYVRTLRDDRGYRFQASEYARVTANTTAAGVFAVACLAPDAAEEVGASLARLLELHEQRATDLPGHFLTWDAELLTALALANAAAAEVGDSGEAASTWKRWRQETARRLRAAQSAAGTWACAEGPGEAFATASACLVLAF